MATFFIAPQITRNNSVGWDKRLASRAGPPFLVLVKWWAGARRGGLVPPYGESLAYRLHPLLCTFVQFHRDEFQ